MHQLMVVLACMCWLLASVATTPLKFQPLDLNVDASAVCGDNKTTCPDMATCCKLSDGEFGCCPFKNAHCCPDGTHCCPENARCDEEKQKCIPTNHLSVFNHLGITKLYHPRRVADVICPGGKEKCPTDMTCCPLGSGIGYGCCPLPKAICCADHTHCCPVGYTCNLPKDTCDKAGSLSIPLLTKQTSVSVDWSNSIDQPHRNNEMNYQLFLGVEDVLCPDRKSKCPAGTTCCMMTTSEWGCCPLPKAVCCKDKLHCCPEGMTCDVAGSRCSSGEHSIRWYDKFIARSDAGENVKHRKKSTAVICPDGKSQCPDQTSCCVMTTGQYGCCPLPKAVCCNDKVHCCPQGTTCDVAQGRCSQKDLSLPWYKKFEASAVNVLPTQEESTSKNGDNTVAKAVICPDGKSQCPDQTSCCVMTTGQYGCCPLQKAVCCNDKVHCCPQGTTCDVAQGRCSQKDLSLPWYKKFEASAVNVLPTQEESTSKNGDNTVVKAVVCPDGKSQCPDQTSCCVMTTGQYGCCPLQKAVCCNDKVHCCPQGTTCDVAQGRCSQKDLSLPWYKKFEASAVNVLPTQEVSPSKNGDNTDVKAVICPDGKSQCPDQTSCCVMTTGQYGCCPLPKAVCCNDKVHCCPQGTTCDVAQGRCSQKDLSLPWYEKFEASAVNVLPTQEESTSKNGDNTVVKAVICPDGKSQCPDQTSCCVMTTGQYGCCPLQKAVCCNDKVHCCPQGTTCDVAQGRCSQKDLSLPWYEKFEASAVNVLPTQEESTSKNGDNTDVKAVICPDGKSQCPDETTCCKMTTGQWGCCPLPNAVCCSDNIHCCPTGTMCDVTHGSCNKVSGDSADSSIPWFMHTPAWERVPTVAVVTPEQRTGLGNLALDNHHSMTLATEMVNKGLSAVICPDGAHQCPDRNTCCKMTTGQYGCCPLLNASCCSDGYHCCPQGYLCDGSMCMNNDSRVTHETNLLEEIFNP